MVVGTLEAELEALRQRCGMLEEALRNEQVRYATLERWLQLRIRNERNGVVAKVKRRLEHELTGMQIILSTMPETEEKAMLCRRVRNIVEFLSEL